MEDGTRYWYRVRAVDANNAGNDSGYSPKKADVTPLLAPTDVAASNLNNETNDISLNWTNASTHYQHVVVRQYAVVDGVTSSTPSQTITLDGSTQSYTFTGNPTGASFVFSAQGINPLTNSSESTKVNNFDEPSSTWTNDLYDSVPPSGSHVTATWSPLTAGEDDMGHPTTYIGGYTNQTVTLVLSNLSRHTWGKISGWIDAEGPPPGDDSWANINFAVSIDGQSMHSKLDDFDGQPAWIGTDYGVSVGDGSAGAPDAFRHKDKTMTITITASDVPNGWTWSPDSLFVDTYLPFVSITGSGTVIEDNSSGEAKFTVSRTGSGTVLSDPLVVSVVNANGNADDAAVEGTRFQPVGSITIPAGANDGSKDVVPIDTDAAEGLQSIYESVKGKPLYALAAPPATAPATGPTAAKTGIDDEPNVHTVKFEFEGGTDHPAGKAVDGLKFDNLIRLTGEHLDQVNFLQLINTWSEVFDTNGNPLGQQAVDSFFGVTGDDRTIHTDGQWLADLTKQQGQTVVMTPMPITVLDAKNSTGIVSDQHRIPGAYSTDGDGTNGTTGWKYRALAEHEASFDDLFTRADNGHSGESVAGKKEFLWDYTWTNLSYAWTSQRVGHVASPSEQGSPDNLFSGHGDGFNAKDVPYVDDINNT